MDITKYLDALGPGAAAIFAIANVAQYMAGRKREEENRQDSADRWKSVNDLAVVVANLTARFPGGGGK